MRNETIFAKNQKMRLIQTINPTDDFILRDVIKNSYAKNKAKAMKGYNLDESLSNHNQKVYYNPNNKKLLYSLAGTHNLADVGTDIYLGVGHLKDTKRYKEAEKTLKQAKQKYNVRKALIAGHSLGGSIAGYIGNPDNGTIFTLDKGATLGQPIRKNENAYRTKGDAISFINANDANMKNLINPNQQTGNSIKDALNSHSVDNVKYSNIHIV